MIPMQISTGILMSQLLILYWNAWPSPEESGKNRCCWIMDVEKGRVDFFLAYQAGCRSIGIEYDDRIYEKAVENQKAAVSSGRVRMEQANAEMFPVPPEVDRIYFFNPFSVEILQKVMNRILDSYYEQMRPIQLFFYYPSDEYLSYLMTVDELMFEDEIECGDLFPGEDPRERIVIFELGG